MMESKNTKQVYFEDKLSMKSKKVDPNTFANPGPNRDVILTPPPSEREQNIPTIVITTPN